MSSDHRGLHAGYSSDLEPDSDVERRRQKRYDLAGPSTSTSTSASSAARFVSASVAPPPKRAAADLYDKEDARLRRREFLQLNAYDRHKILVNNYIAHYGGKLDDFAPKNKVIKSDIDVIKEHHQFLWEDGEEGNGDSDSESMWGRNLAKRYYDKLFKEYCIADLSRFKENKVAMRWRTEREVVSGKGQFSCGERKCREQAGLASWEVNFGYIEKGNKKNALVKLRLCPDCSNKLNFHHKKNLASPSLPVKSELLTPKREDVEATSESQSSNTTEIWQQPVQRDDAVEKTVEEEMDSYLADLFF